MSDGCICVPCTSPAYGAPGRAHCAACCYGSMIAEYDHDCPIPEHREMAVSQFGPRPSDLVKRDDVLALLGDGRMFPGLIDRVKALPAREET